MGPPGTLAAARACQLGSSFWSPFRAGAGPPAATAGPLARSGAVFQATGGAVPDPPGGRACVGCGGLAYQRARSAGGATTPAGAGALANSGLAGPGSRGSARLQASRPAGTQGGRSTGGPPARSGTALWATGGAAPTPGGRACVECGGWAYQRARSAGSAVGPSWRPRAAVACRVTWGPTDCSPPPWNGRTSCRTSRGLRRAPRTYKSASAQSHQVQVLRRMACRAWHSHRMAARGRISPGRLRGGRCGISD